MALGGTTDDDLSGVASAEAHIIKMADESLVDGSEYGSFYESLDCSAEGPGLSTEIVPLTLSGTGSTHVTWNYDWTPSARGIFCFEVHATDVADNVENTGISGPVSVLASLTPPPTGGGGGGSGTPSNTVTTFAYATPTSSSGGQVAGASTGDGEVLGAETTCGIYLNDYLKMDKNNNAEEVKKLQIFLNENLGAAIPITGFFGPMTFGAVNDFQIKYFEDVLKPWVAHGLPTEKTPTGYVYKTTKRWINHLKCADLDLPMPQLP